MADLGFDPRKSGIKAQAFHCTTLPLGCCGQSGMQNVEGGVVLGDDTVFELSIGENS